MGASTARELFSRGCPVVIVDRNADLARRVVSEIGCGPAIIGDVSESVLCDRAMASDDASYMTGALVPVDAGYSAR